MAIQKIPRQQRGVATVLIVLLLGLSLTVAVLTGIQYNRSAQEQAISLHAQTAAQARAWEAAEAVRLYFQELAKSSDESAPTFDQIEAATDTEDGGIFITTSVSDVIVKLTDAWRDPVTNSPLFQIKITAEAARNTRAHAITTLEAVIAYNSSEGDSVPSTEVVSFGGDTDLSGGIKISVEPGKTYDIAVDGNITIGGVSISGAGDSGGINSIRSTKSINFTGGSSTFFERLHANCDIKLAAGASSAGVIHALNNICLANTNTQSGKTNAEVRANGSVYLSGGDKWGKVLALANKNGHQSCAPEATKYCSNSNMVPTNPGIELGNSTITQSAYTHGHVESLGRTVTVHADKDINLTYRTDAFDRAELGGKCIAPNWNKVCEKAIEGRPPIADLAPVLPVNITPEVLDVNELEPYANYIFEYINNKITVEVKNINNIPDGKYQLCHPSSKANSLCKADGTVVSGPIASGSWAGDTGAIKYNTSTDKWTFTSSTSLAMAPGLVIFKGNLSLTGTFINTIAATGNIDTFGSLKIYSLNYTGYNGNREGNLSRFSPKSGEGVCTQLQFNNLYPNNLCSSTEYNGDAISGYGNYGLLAGSCKLGTDCKPPTNYNGGNIHIGSSNEIFGSVKAGGTFTNSGSTTVHGFVSGLGNLKTHTLGNSFIIDLTKLPEGYDPGGSSGGSGGSNGAGNIEVTILWSRYL